MALNIRNHEAERLAGELAKLTGESKTKAVTIAVRDRIERLRRYRRGHVLGEELRQIADHCAALPVCDPRGPDCILGYDEQGLP